MAREWQEALFRGLVSSGQIARESALRLDPHPAGLEPARQDTHPTHVVDLAGVLTARNSSTIWSSAMRGFSNVSQWFISRLTALQNSQDSHLLFKRVGEVYLRLAEDSHRTRKSIYSFFLFLSSFCESGCESCYGLEIRIQT